MNFDFSEEAISVRDLAARIFGDRATVERIKEVEAGEDRVDRDLWRSLADAGLLGVALPESAGGAGLGLLELVLLAEEQGRRVAPVPLVPTVVGALALAEAGEDVGAVIGGDSIVALALWEAGGADPRSPLTRVEHGRLTGVKLAVDAAHLADRVLVTAADGLYAVDPQGEGVTLTRNEATNRQIACDLTFDGAPATRLGDESAARRVVDHYELALCGITVGVCEAANRQAAEYTSNRIQFGKPLSTFQGVTQKAADSYIDTAALRWTTIQAAWRLSEGLDAEAELLAAKWWAAEAGHYVTHRTQHLHGGMGADIDYPVHRYFLWGKQLAMTLGGASETLARLGDVLVEARA